MNILGSGAVGGIISAAIACVPSLQNPNPAATLEIYLGDALMARAADYTGVRPRPANEAGFLSPCAIFFVSNTPLSVTITDSSFTNIANSHTPLITFETGVNGVVINSNFQGNTGQLHGTIAVSSFMHIDVIGCQFIGNACSCGGAECGDSACHNAAVYVTEGATSNIVGCMFKDNVGQ
ncbi:hypothetical protein WJX72_000346 [[Myrmecia] bisecta]|uniref:Uncharacterized protein n=1 Tax=[Myrmecia] bisecta TaxID=41462 RepID=A0AAW1P9I5_9CHLO